MYTPPKATGFLVIPVLEFLKAQAWDAYTRGMVDALRPSEIRECWDECKTDAKLWRVTVWLTGFKHCPLIRRIEQEVQVGLDGGHENGNALREYLYDQGMPPLTYYW